MKDPYGVVSVRENDNGEAACFSLAELLFESRMSTSVGMALGIY